MSAAAEGDVGAMMLLLEYGANPNALNSYSENPLGYAVRWQQPRAIEVLVAAGAEINNMDDSGPGMTQLDWAVLSQWTEIASVARALGAKRFEELEAP
jgi:ankyrin repeat protein